MHAPSPNLLRALRRLAIPRPGPPLVLDSHSSRPYGSFDRCKARALTTSTLRPSPPPAKARANPHAPRTHDRGPSSTEETQTDFSKMDILANAGAAVPATSIDACTRDGFHLNNGVTTRGGMGMLLLGGEVFVWTPWDTTIFPAGQTSGKGERPGFGRLLDKRGVLNIPPQSLGLLGLLYPKPDLLIVGTGRKLWMLGRETKAYLFEELGIKVDVMDTANAAAAYNLLSTERGTTEVGALMIPDGFQGT